MKELGTRFVRKDGRICVRGRDYDVGRDWGGQIVRLERNDSKNLIAINESNERRACMEVALERRPMVMCRKCKRVKIIYAKGLCQTCYGEERSKLYRGQRSEFIDWEGIKSRCLRCAKIGKLNKMGHCHSCAMTIANQRAKSRKKNDYLRSLELRITTVELEVRQLKEDLRCRAR